jgi:hypothetical protein
MANKSSRPQVPKTRTYQTISGMGANCGSSNNHPSVAVPMPSALATNRA